MSIELFSIYLEHHWTNRIEMKETKENNDIIIYQTEDGVTQIEVRLENDTVWLTQQQISELFQRERSVIQDTDC